MATKARAKRTPTLPKEARPNVVDGLLRNSAKRPATRISHVARALASRPSNLNEFKNNLVRKLENYPHPYPPENSAGRTVLQWLKGYGVLPILLDKDLLAKIRDTLLLFRIASEDAKFERDNRAGSGYPVKFHCGVWKELDRHSRHLDRLRDDYKVPETWLSAYEEEIGKQEVKELEAIMSARWPGSRKELVGQFRSIELAAALAVFRVLKVELKKTGLSDRFLYVLAPIISSPWDKPAVSPESLRKAASRLGRTEETRK